MIFETSQMVKNKREIEGGRFGGHMGVYCKILATFL